MYRIDDYRFMEKPNQVQIMEKLVEQHLVADIDASTWYENDTWRKDVIHSLKPPNKSGYCLTNDIVIVGYDKSKNEILYWVVRDSNWTGCGMRGYLKIHR
ncbi:hypothetical protein A2U01_0014521, partial [Trifolium medium]|nr:hypothetical protein [Trifolium medium]